MTPGLRKMIDSSKSCLCMMQNGDLVLLIADKLSLLFYLDHIFMLSLSAMSGLGLGDILKPDLIMPLIETLPLEQRLAPYLPEVYTIFVFEFF